MLVRGTIDVRTTSSSSSPGCSTRDCAMASMRRRSRRCGSWAGIRTSRCSRRIAVRPAIWRQRGWGGLWRWWGWGCCKCRPGGEMLRVGVPLRSGRGAKFQFRPKQGCGASGASTTFTSHPLRGRIPHFLKSSVQKRLISSKNARRYGPQNQP